jgi:diacylglycerol kinase (ATP)
VEWTALINPSAGRGRARRLVPRVRAALDASALPVTVHVSTSAADALAVARAARDAGHGLVACGGDGTVRDLAGLCADTDGLLAVIPTGSGNDFARQLGIPRGDVVAAVALIEQGHVRVVDLGRARAADGAAVWFTTVANAGFDAEANRWANTVTWTSGNPLYILAVLRTLRSHRPTRVQVTVDGHSRVMAAWLVAVANTQTYASGMMIAPDAVVDDGALDVCVVGDVSRAEFLRTFPSVYRGGHVRHPMVTMRRGSSITIASSDPAAPLELWASGEPVGPLPAEVTVVPGALRVVASPRERSGRGDTPVT